MVRLDGHDDDDGEGCCKKTIPPVEYMEICAFPTLRFFLIQLY